MSKKLRVAILGAGNGGQAIAGWISSKGCEVGITDLFPKYLSPLHKLREIELFGTVSAKGNFRIYDNPAECVRGANVIMMVTAAPGHKRIIEKVAPALKDGQIFIVSPGYWSHLTIPIYLKNLGYQPNLIYAETESLVYVCRAIEPGKVFIAYVKNELGIGVQPKEETSRVLNLMRPFYPQLKDMGNIFKVTLNNINFSLHPCILLLNSARAESTQTWLFYKEGTSESVIRLIEGIDAERLALGKAAGLLLTSVYELLKRYYTVPEERDLLSLLRQNPAYQKIISPSTIDDRYFNEDIPYGLVPMTELSRVFDLFTPVMDSVIQLSSTLLRKDFWKMGLHLSGLGLEGIKREEFSRIMK